VFVASRLWETPRVGTNVADLLATAARAEPGRIALSEAASGRNVTWSVLDDLADRVAHGLSSAGMVAGYRVMIAATNRIEFVATYFGVLRARMVAVPINPRSATGEVVRMLVDSGARMVVADPTTIGTIRAAVVGVREAMEASGDEAATPPRVVGIGIPEEDGERTWDQLVSQTGASVPGETDGESLAVLLYTSGTSGRPRAAMLSHRALLANIEQAAAVDPPMITGRDVVLGVLPLFHVYGLNAVLGQVARQHARLVLVDGFDPEGTLDIVEDEAISVLPVAPPVFAYWMQVPALEERLGPVRMILSGSAPLAPDLSEAFTARTGLPIHQGYGLTEAAPVVTSALCSKVPTPRSVGAALPGVEIRLADDQGAAPEEDDGGEILIRGDNLFSGYWPDGVDGPDSEGWWATGDVGYLDEDGDLYLVDRIKDLVIVSGFNVYPSEVEDVITELDAVAQAAVIGVEDELTGEAVVAYVRPAREIDREQLAEQVRAHCVNRLAGFKQPQRIHVTDDLPSTITGKVQKGRLRATERRRALGLLES
jgi:long-chain acyl-CoA synthetase